jgi:mRNA interferase MazF
MTACRGELWWARLDPTVGSEIKKTRPCLVMTADVLNERRRTVVVVPISSSPAAAPPLMVAVRCEGQAAVAVIDQIRAISKERLVEKIGRVSAAELRGVEEAVRAVLELD